VKKIKIGQEKAEKLVDGFFDVPEKKKKISSIKELKKIIYEQYDEEIP